MFDGTLNWIAENADQCPVASISSSHLWATYGAGGIRARSQQPLLLGPGLTFQPARCDRDGLASVTATVWAMLWVASTLGYMLGYSYSSSVLIVLSPAWRTTFFPKGMATAGLGPFLISHSRHDLSVAYCNDVSGMLQWFAASRYLASICSLFFAAWLENIAGRRATLSAACVLYLSGKLLMCTAFHTAQMAISNLIVGASVAFIYSCVMLGTVELSPTQWRGAFLVAGMLGASVGYACAMCVFWAKGIRLSAHGWRLGVAAGCWPAAAVLLLLPFLMDTPDSLIMRGHITQGREALQKIRGPFADIDSELNRIWMSAWHTKPSQPAVEKIKWARLMRKQLVAMRRPSNWVPVAVCGLVGILRESVGSFIIAPIVPHLLARIGNDVDKALWTGGMLLEASFVLGHVLCVVLVDWVGRRPLLQTGAVLGFASWSALAGIIGSAGAVQSLEQKRLIWAAVVLLAVTNFAIGLSWEPVWAPLAAESHSLSVRATAVSLCVALMLAMRTVVLLTINTMLCKLKWRMLVVAAACNLLMMVVAALLVPETRRVPLQEMPRVWQEHWLWGRLCREPDAAGDQSAVTQLAQAAGRLSARSHQQPLTLQQQTQRLE